MSKKDYDWENGAVLEEHSKKKHAILKEYFREYLLTRCQMIHQKKFRLIIVDGFSGSGIYKCGTYGSPLIFIQTLLETTAEINISRRDKNFTPIEFECFLLFNDYDTNAIEFLKKNVDIIFRERIAIAPHIKFSFSYHNLDFRQFYKQNKQRLLDTGCNNVFFNLDQCGYIHTTSDELKDIMQSWRSAEIILTFMIKSMLTYLSQTGKNNNVPLEPVIRNKIVAIEEDSESPISKIDWLGQVEKIVFYHFESCAKYVSPFSINNPNGWKYWLMHFANSCTARKVYNDVLHSDIDTQVHCGRSGLEMLSYDPSTAGNLYLFDENSRESARRELYDDIPRFLENTGGRRIPIRLFYEQIYNKTPAHCDDIHQMIIENPDVRVETAAGGKRQKAHTIKKTDLLILNEQKTFSF